MTAYLGSMPTRNLRDDLIRPTEYRRWADARKRFELRRKDAGIMSDLMASIPVHGVQVPIILGVSLRHGDVYVAEGHHRAVALMSLGTPKFPFHWYWIKSFGVRMEHDPFPYHLIEDALQ